MALSDPVECHICRLPLARNNSLRHNQCPFCGRAFRRVDGAKRHTKTCASRGNRSLPPDAKRGRKVHACDVCSRIKVSCDSKSPCTRCASRGLSCTYGRLCTDPTHHLAKSIPGEQPQSTKESRSTLPFLLACTDPSVGPIDEVILNREPEHRPGEPAVWESSDNHAIILDTIDPRLLFLSFIGPSFSTGLDCDDTGDGPLPGVSDQLESSDERLSARVSLLEADLRQVTAEENVRNFFDTTASTAFFTGSNFCKCIKVFFQRELLLATIIHQPTFHPDQVDQTLLLAIAISGSTYLHYQQGGTEFSSFALILRGIAEKYIFHRVEELLSSTVHSADSQRTLEVCQAAYIIETLQSCVKDAAVRQRLITKYHPMLVELLRSLNMIGTKHGLLGLQPDWHSFVYKESCIRLVHWLFINDAWFTLFSNHPPAMTLCDMSGDLPCENKLWNMNSPASFKSFKFQQECSRSSPCLKSLISTLLEDEWTDSIMVPYKQLDIKHFLVIIFAFQHAIFHYHTSMLIGNGSVILIRGLDRWSQLWNDAMSCMDIEKRKALGLVKYSAELAHLLRRIIEVGRRKEGLQPKYLEREITYDTTALHQFIRQCTE